MVDRNAQRLAVAEAEIRKLRDDMDMLTKSLRLACEYAGIIEPEPLPGAVRHLALVQA